MAETTSFKSWCIIELFGHQKIAGLCTEQNIAGTNMLRVDVPETSKQPAFTRLFGAAAIYAINPVDENTAKVMAEGIQAAPVSVWQGDEFIRKINEQKALNPAIADDTDNGYDIDGDSELAF